MQLCEDWKKESLGGIKPCLLSLLTSPCESFRVQRRDIGIVSKDVESSPPSSIPTSERKVQKEEVSRANQPSSEDLHGMLTPLSAAVVGAKYSRGWCQSPSCLVIIYSCQIIVWYYFQYY